MKAVIELVFLDPVGEFAKNVGDCFGVLNNFWAAISAYERVAERFPNDHVTCREKSRILRQQNEPLKPP